MRDTQSHQQLTALKTAINVAIKTGVASPSINLLKSAGLCPRTNSPELADLITRNLHDLDIPGLEGFLDILVENEHPETAIRFACNIFYKSLHSDRRQLVNSIEASPDKLCVQDYRIFWISRVSKIKSKSSRTKLALKLFDHANKNLDKGDLLYLISSNMFPCIDINWNFKDYIERDSSRLKNIECNLYGLITHISSEEDSHPNKIESKDNWSKKGLASYQPSEAFTSLPWVKKKEDNGNKSTWSGHDLPYSDVIFSEKPFSTSTFTNTDNKVLGRKRLMQSLEITGVIESLCRKLGRPLVVLDIGGYYANSFLLTGFNDSWNCIKKWIVADITKVCDAFPSAIKKLNLINSSVHFREQIAKLDCIYLDKLYSNSDLKDIDLIYTCSSLMLEPKFAHRMSKWVSLSPSRIFIHQMDYIINSNESESFFQIYKPYSQQYWFLYSARYIKV